MVNLAQAWAEEYATVDPDGVRRGVGRRFRNRNRGAHRGDGRDCQLQPADSKPSEIEQARKSRGKEPREFLVGYDALAVYVSTSNPIQEITLDQLAQIYGEGGTVTKWSQLGVKMPDGADEIIRVSRQSNSGTYAYFREAILGKGHDFKLGSRDMHGSKDVVELVSKTPQAIGYSGMGYAIARGARCSGSRRRPASRACPPTVENTLSQRLPDRPRRCSCTRSANPSGAAKKYLDWIHSPAGQEIVVEERLRAASGEPGPRRGRWTGRRANAVQHRRGWELAVEKGIEALIRLCGVSAIVFVFGIFFFVFREGSGFLFSRLNPLEFFTQHRVVPDVPEPRPVRHPGADRRHGQRDRAGDGAGGAVRPRRGGLHLGVLRTARQGDAQDRHRAAGGHPVGRLGVHRPTW